MEDDFGHRVIDIKPPRKRRIWLYVAGAAIVMLFLFGSQFLSIYIESLWFSSLGYSDVYWYKFRLGALLFFVFLVLTFLIVRLPLAWLGRLLPQLNERPKISLASVEDVREINVLAYVYRPGAWVVSAIVAVMYGVTMSGAWSDFALYLHAQPGGTSDPIFNRDVSFYVLKLPVLTALSSWLLTLAVILFVAMSASAGYIWYLEKMQGYLSASTRRRVVSAISSSGAFLALTVAIAAHLSRYDLLTARQAIFTGVSYSDANAWLPGLNVLLVVLLIAALALALNAFVMRRGRLIIWVSGLVVSVWLIALVLIPQAVHYFSVKPNELAKEAPFIERNIEMTRRGFALDRFEEKQFQPAATLSIEQIRANQDTLDNVRLWDPPVLQSTYGQNQVIRTYYRFNTPDVDRYLINGKRRQVMLAARELNVAQLPEQNWINQHLVYTHGYGVAMSTVNEFTTEGLPHLVLKNMPVESDAPEIKVTRPEIYFGEMSDTHVYVHTKPQAATQPEFNYPAPDNTASYSEYEGAAGIEVGGAFRQMALSMYLGDGTNLLFSGYITSESRVLIRRNVRERAALIAPFLIFEDDPYIVISREGRLLWVIDAFTYSDRYPYSTSDVVAHESANYLRNSVKVVIDAYEGETRFYVFEPDDPIIRSYQEIFPSLFQPASAMPADVREHIRYPEMLAEAQARAYTLYHTQNAQTFYNREDLWAIARGEQTAQQTSAVGPGGVAVQNTEPPPMKPYYVVMKLPTPGAQLEFVSVVPFTPAGPGRNNMIGWMAARSDAEHYGQTLVFAFPKNLTVSGPDQIRARVNQDAQLSTLMTLWNQKGSELVRGNLLVIPIADSLLYVESFYLQAERGTSKLPELRQVAVATQDRLATAKSFDEALKVLFTELASQAPSPPASGEQTPAKSPSPAQRATQPAATDLERFAKEAQRLFSDYERLTAEGKHREAGEKLDQIKRVIEEMNRRRRQE
ncbi:MAG TPA: UPF0182 family protein [Blastocatellia bacterium]|nr:UPF0182 family protein [Blastocatellia bacterium]